MSDLVLAIVGLALGSMLLFLLALRLGCRISRRAATGIVGSLLLLTVHWHAVLRDTPVAARLLPVSNAIVLAGWAPLAAGLAGGLVCHHAVGQWWRKMVLVASLILSSWVACVWPMLGSPPPCRDRWRDGVALQSSDSTCVAACAATLLHTRDIAAGEREMAGLCLTRASGTAFLGVYRGLRLKTESTPWEALPFASDLQGLRTPGALPALLVVWLDEDATEDPRYREEWGWLPGVPHTVVLFRFLDGHCVEVGDPAIGRERWSVRDIETLWHGTGIRLAYRDGSGDSSHASSNDR